MRLFLFLLLMTTSLYSQNDSLENLKRFIIFPKNVNTIIRQENFYKYMKATPLQKMTDDKRNLEALTDSDKDGIADFDDGIFVDDKMEAESVVYPDINEIPEEKLKKRLVGPTQFDSRIEMHQLTPTIDWQNNILKNCESIAIIIEKSNIKKITKNYYYLQTTTTLGSYFNLCSDVPFNKQPILKGGSGFIISDNSMITAAHVFQKPLSEYMVVFGYRLIYANNVVENFLKISDVYFPKEVVKNHSTNDLIEFRVDRKFDRPALQLGSSTSAKERNEVYMIGHPSGLPLKISVNSSIIDNTPLQYFYTTLDSFMGNSGSPVFDSLTNTVIGILVSGEVDFQYNGNCNRNAVCRISECIGEKVVRVEMLQYNH